jgi:hypothetical protein
VIPPGYVAVVVTPSFSSSCGDEYVELFKVNVEFNVVAAFACNVVNAPVEGVVLPTGVLLIEPPLTTTPLSLPPVIVAFDEAKLFAVTNPVPNVTCLLLTVLIESVPVDESITGAAAFNPRFPLRIEFPVTANVLFNVVAPVTPSVPPTFALLVDEIVVNAPVEGVVAPIAVPLIEPPVIAALDEAKLFAVVDPVNVFAPLPLWVYPPEVVIPEIPVSAPPVETFRPVEDNAKVPVEFPIDVADPAAAAIVAFPFWSNDPDKVVAPDTFNVFPSVVAPVTPSVPPIVSFPLSASEVNAPVEGVVAPIAVPFTEPPVIAALLEVKLFAVVGPFRLTAPVPVPKVPVPDCRKFPLLVMLVNAPVEGVTFPIGVLLIAPPLIAAFDETKLLAVVAPVKVFAPVPLWV